MGNDAKTNLANMDTAIIDILTMDNSDNGIINSHINKHHNKPNHTRMAHINSLNAHNKSIHIETRHNSTIGNIHLAS